MHGCSTYACHRRRPSPHLGLRVYVYGPSSAQPAAVRVCRAGDTPLSRPTTPSMHRERHAYEPVSADVALHISPVHASAAAAHVDEPDVDALDARELAACNVCLESDTTPHTGR